MPPHSASPPHCPKCLSSRVETKDYAKTAAGTVGLVGGTASGILRARQGAEIGAAVGNVAGIVAGPVGSRVGRWIGALVGGLVGGATGALAGAQIGHVIDEHLLDNYHCLVCDHHFRLPTNEAIRSSETDELIVSASTSIAP